MTATSRYAPAGVVALSALLIAVAGCGNTSVHSPGQGPSGNAVRAAQPFGWLRPAAAGAGWHVTRIPDGGTLAYPVGWRAIPGDAGTASAALRASDGRYLAYLNITPRQGDEREQDWGSFRARHNSAEGDTDVRVSAFARGLSFRDGHGACVQDSYTTAVGVRYTEIACLVQGRRTANVIVGASPPQQWSREAPSIEQAISATGS